MISVFLTDCDYLAEMLWPWCEYCGENIAKGVQFTIYNMNLEIHVHINGVRYQIVRRVLK